MRKVRFSAAASLDGFIAGPNGEYDWIVVDPEVDFGAWMSAFDTALVGRRTYETMRDRRDLGLPGIDVFVFSRTLRAVDCPGASVSNDLGGTVRALKAKVGRDIWLFGGGSLLRSLLDLGLVDEVEVVVVPVLLGDGVPLLPTGARARLRLVQHRVYVKTGTVQLTYEPTGE